MKSGTRAGTGAASALVRGGAVFGCLLVGATLFGCSSPESSAAQSAPAQAAPASEGDVPAVLATIGDQKITMEDVRARAGKDLDGLDTNYQRARHKLIETALDEILRDKVLMAEAQKQGKSVDELVLAEAGGTLDPSDVEVSAWYQANQSRLGGRSLEQLRPQIVDYLRKQRQEDAMEKLQRRLNDQRKVTINLQPYRLQFNNEGAAAMGPADAPVTLVEFSDFQCPFCGRFFPTLKQIEQNFGDTVRIVYRQLPLPNLHPNAQKAAEASLCAKEQGKFWEMHDLMFQEQDKLAVADLKEKAARLGLNQKKFDECLDAGRYVEQIQADVQEASRVGVNGTPSIFVNGIPLPAGAVAYDVVAKAIHDDLARRGGA